ncbi:hypothetical protein GOBAR_AA39047 [Gossypium barbadense]|uniref:KH type-2 domain-containing protein n=1 Tax=Gossypium barbadense TaxID=3634 RepID=A0A2P5VS71_GOSBA|nr:hypothetical protein GOBAR_AA39047 [Gossypium barbadense]
MPPFTAIALDRLIESGDSKSVDKSSRYLKPPIPPNSKLRRRNSTSAAERKGNRPQISPALYATPDATPLPDSTSFFPSSPYIVNHKRRGPCLSRSSSEILSRQITLEEDEWGQCANAPGCTLVYLPFLFPPELSSNNAPHTFVRDIEAELREIRSNLLIEIEKRKKAEETLNQMRCKWQRISQEFAVAGLALPVDPVDATDDELVKPVEELRQQESVARLVSLSVGRGVARAEMQMEMESQIKLKNFEVARLLDRLHYYKAVNQEMSQRNQEAIEMARRDRQRKKRRQKWVWGSIAAAITLGMTALAWSYLPSGKASSASSARITQAPVSDDAITKTANCLSTSGENSGEKRTVVMELLALHISPTLARECFLTASNNNSCVFPRYVRNRHGKSRFRFQARKGGSRSWNPNKISRLDLIQQVLERNNLIEDSQEEDEDEDEISGDDSSFLSLSEKPDRNMALLDEYELEELDFTSPTNHRSGYVAVLGKPNVGKSTLANQMIGQKLSIVTDKPQTTRHRVLGICSGPEYQWYEKFTDVDEVIPVSAKYGHGVDDIKDWILSKLPTGPPYYPKMILYDTPGVIEKKMHKLDSMMMKNVRSAALMLTVYLLLLMHINEVLEEGVGDFKCTLPTLLVLNKKDLIKPGEIAKKLEDIVSEHPERFFVAEIVREKIFMQYRNEVPYACQVNVVSYKTRPNAKEFIQVEIVVEKDSQKIILIGKGGKALKTLATAARLDIEDFLQKKVFLEVEVKVKENWRQDEGLLRYYGYGGQIRAL